MYIPESETTEPKVINISSLELCDSEIALLEKGLKFTPTPKQNKRELKNDLQEFGSKLRLLEHFSGHEQQPDSSLVKNKSNFVPPLPNDRHLRLCLENISNPHDENPTLKQKSNVTSSERTALQILEKDESIIIKQADKGGATAIMDKSYYRDKMQVMV